MTAIGYSILSAMKAQGLTQKALAEKAHVSQSAISAIVHGTAPKDSTLSAICAVLGTTPAKISEKTTQEVNVCPRCGSKAIIEWFNHGTGHYRFRCAYCEADSEEQKSRADAIRVFNSFGNKAERRAQDDIHVMSLAELLDVSFFDADDVRTVWFENRGLFIVPALLQYGGAERELELVKVTWFGKMSPSSYLLENYNNAWRCWNSRPTAERSDAEQWKVG